MQKIPKLSFNQILIGVAVIIVVINLVVIGFFVMNRGSDAQQGRSLEAADPSSYAVLFTSPVYTFSGEVISVTDTEIEVSYQPEFFLPPEPDIQQPEEEPEPVLVTVQLDDQTSIIQQEPFVPLILVEDEGSEPLPPFEDESQEASVNEITQGDRISVNTSRDLRMMTDAAILAQSITIQPPPNRLNGVVVSNQGGVLTIQGRIDDGVFGSNDTEQEYQVQISDSTVIRDISTDPGASAVVPVSSISTDQFVEVFFDPDTAGQTLQAEFIEVFTEPASDPLPPDEDLPVEPIPLPETEASDDPSDQTQIPPDQPVEQQAPDDPAQINSETEVPPDAPLVP